MRWRLSFRFGLPALFAFFSVFMLKADERAFITNQNAETMSILDLELGEEIHRTQVPGRAAGVAVDHLAARVYTISPDDAVLRAFDMDGTLCQSLELEGGPLGVAIDPKRQRGFVSDWYQAKIHIIELSSFTRAGALITGSAPSGLDVSPDGAFLASADRDSNQVSLFSAESLDLVARINVGERPFGVTFSDDNILYITNVGSNSISVIDPKTASLIATIPTGERPYSVAFAAGYGFVSDQYSDQITVFRESDFELEKTIPVGEYPEGLDRNQGESKIYVANWFSNTISVIDVATLKVEGEIAVDDGPRAFGRFIGEYQSRSPCK